MEHSETNDNDDSQQSTTKNVTVSVSEEGFSQITDFSDGDFPGFIKKAFEKQGFKKPTPIQSHVWPIALKGRDIVGIAQTGSGKTLAYGLPAILHICGKQDKIRKDEPTVLVLAPTRELVQQINTVFTDVLAGSSITNVCIFGGASKESQIYHLDRGFNILIATPGRLIDFLESRRFTLKGCTFLVLDEADRMLDMGFEPQIRTILEEITSDRQTLMFSATWPEEVQCLAEEFLLKYVQVNVGAMQLSANHNIKQIIEVLDEGEKDEKLLELLKSIMKEEEKKTIIFAATKIRVSELTSNLKNEGYPVICMHGNKSQSEREYALRQFRDGTSFILVATDVAARGLDVDDIKFVINVDYPNSSEDYVHRIGRTARVNNSGTAYTFFTFQDMKQAQDLVDILTEAKQDINPALMNLVEMSKTFGSGKGRSLGACSLGSGRYESNERKPKKQDKFGKKEWDYGHNDRDNNRNWGRDNNRNRGRDNRNWNRGSHRNWDSGNHRNRDNDYNRNSERDSNRNWNRDNYRSEDRDYRTGDRDYRSEDRDYRDVDQDSYGSNPKKPRHYEYERKTFPRPNKSQPYDSSKDTNLLLQYNNL